MDNQNPNTHKQFAMDCFNQVWDILENKQRTPQEEEDMIHMCHSSFWHWTRVEDHTQRNLSIGYWQLSRVYAVVGQGDQALRYAKRCITVGSSASLEPFYIGYGYEAEARAYLVLGDKERALASKESAGSYLDKVTEQESRNMLALDLDSLS
ncbi:hypothetical protein PVOR_18644 [Paenibacillus vortex V453]|uniref:Uncharacterized protein n=1 Tax=Paenibacillus vortex V453 TaxID=715225 RepID=A0A2R9SU79_9BACL|nr:MULTISPECIES: hypothetical protein [Paenibacillus]EFU40893.1 hypothetical protein PVOR_18644 [Paenibacillus vortex V453]MDH6670776.1 tetratricopeptide (TPR) repeat protein [Paenibacillus sp. LBL]